MPKSFIWLSGMTVSIIMLTILVVFEKFIYSDSPFEFTHIDIQAAAETSAAEPSTPEISAAADTEAANEISENTETESKTDSENTDITIAFFNGSENIMISLEDFVLGALTAEMPASFESEALKAQAAAIRTYALRKQLSFEESELGTAIHKNAAICGDPNHCCAYISPDDYIDKYGEPAISALEKLDEAVKATAGEIITYNGSLIDAVFHSRSFRSTESASELWGYDIPYLQAVDSPEEDSVSVYIYSIEEFCSLINTPDSITTAKSMNSEENIKYIYLNSEDSGNIRFISDLTESGRVKSISLGQTSFTGTELRTKLSLPSSMFEIYELDGRIVITAHGSGHGVGMSQYGADAMAKNGADYRKIIKHYYSGCDIHYLYKIFT